MRVDGPYGEFQEHPEWTHYKTLVIIAGGIGVSQPFEADVLSQQCLAS